MNIHAIYHRAKQNWSYAYDNKTLHIRIRTQKGDMDRVELFCGDKYDWPNTNQQYAMKLWLSDNLFDYWEVEVEPPFRRLVYYFGLHAGDETLYVMEKGFLKQPPENVHYGAFDFPYINPVEVFTPPAWVKDAVFYQIFPERFANGDPSINPEGTLPWGGEPTPKNFFGGDLQGVIDHLDHLTELGVNAIYFNPLFQATTNHRYDTSDYLKVDPTLGTNEKLKELVEKCHERGIRVVLDAVFNHCGKLFAPFVDVLENGEKSKYKDWFHVREFPLTVNGYIPTYETFGFEPIMPKLNTENAEVKEYLLKVARYWIEEVGIDGWRLDVANEVDHHFWREFRQTVKGINQDAYILGEIMHDSLPWLQGDQFDAVMNYPFTNAVFDFFARDELDAAGFSSAICTQLASYQRQVNEVSFNLLGSHDTSRLMTACNDNEGLVKLSTLFKLTYPGSPCIYYGDEIGLDGENDPYCRKCMEWDREKRNESLFDFFKWAVALRKNNSALRTGSFSFIQAEEGSDQIIYERADSKDRFIILMNRGSEPATLVTGAESFTRIDTNTSTSVSLVDGKVSVTLPAYGYAVLRTDVTPEQKQSQAAVPTGTAAASVSA
ncbi:alpha-glycosidase [Paenibacillus sp. MMS18-CY102]|uniref:alpha-glycosidase n=1 Tax=Paenibacillus sp. MMS18-CY102 TaxID=2682849 RepID=UPI0013664A7D|nr:alpha-glycosidase [Paenibacillus sp. MMS18-CY102]MWC26988.1 alpha-glycosidase [Paenibacillus sp. MMS18-CY102]